MAQYKFKAKSIEGEEKTGVREAEDETQLAHILHQEGFVLVEVNLANETKRKFSFSLSFLGVNLKDRIFFCKNLQVMAAAGLSLPRAISILAEQTANKTFKTALEQIKEDLTKGNAFSAALEKYPKIFSMFFCSMVKVGEETGTLENVLGISVNQMEKEYSLNSKVKGAMMYPAVILVVMLGIGMLMLATVVPTLAATFAELKVDLPVTTKAVIAAGAFVQNYWWVVILMTAAIGVAAGKFLGTKTGRKVSADLILKIPAISGVVRNVNSAYTVRNLSSLIGAGVSLPRALEITADTVGNVNYTEALLDIKERIKKGEKFSDAIKDYDNIYPLTAIQMIAVGEETGETSNILAKLAEFYENEVDEATKNFAAIIEPMLMVIIGIIVGFFAVSMVQPMYSMMDSVG